MPLYSAVNLGHLERVPTAPNVNHIHLFDFEDNKKNCRLLPHKLVGQINPSRLTYMSNVA